MSRSADTTPAGRIAAVAASGILVVVLSSLAALSVGAADIPLPDVARILFGLESTHQQGPGHLDADVRRNIVLQLRLPRVLVGLGVGATLAVAGVLLQGLFRNALAAPGVVGTSAGGAFGAVLALSLAQAQQSMLLVPFAAIAGSLAALLAVARVARYRGRTSVTDLLLAGVALNAFLSATNSFLIARSWVDYEAARRINFWLMGGISDRNWSHIAILAPGTAVGLALAWIYARDLDLLLQGEDLAQSMGVAVESLKRTLLFATALLVGSAVAVSGVVGFVGLVVPHLVRLLIGPSHRPLVLLSALIGAGFVLLSDLVARTAVAPGELQLGIVTAFVGAPFFVLLLLRERRLSVL